MLKTIAIAALSGAALSPAFGQAMPAMPGMAQGGATTGMSGAPGEAGGRSDAAMPGMTMAGGAYASGSGTSRVPAQDRMQGLHVAAGDWMLMVHGYAWGSWTHQGGPRGSAEAFVQSMAMVEASRPIGEGTTLQLRSMLSLDPLMGERGYPNLFAIGETAHGQPLVDRQHPHDLFMELSGRLDFAVGDGSLFVYGGLPGEPALGPSAFMHRGSDRFLPEAPITHHWFDSTHISFGVVTAGWSAPRWQLEASAFNGREPDEHRWNIETAALDSWSVRASWTPDPHWAAQLSYGRLHHPEALEPGADEGRTTASISYSGGGVDMTAGFARKDRLPGRALTAWLLEGTWAVTRRHALFGRIENVANDELFEREPAAPLAGRAFRVTRFTAGYAYTLPLGRSLSLAIGADASLYAKPAALDPVYGDAPKSVTAFAKLMLGK